MRQSTATAPATNGHPTALSLVDGLGAPPLSAPTAERYAWRPVDRPTDHSDRPTAAATAKAVAPLVVVNALAIYGQLAYALERIAPTDWPVPARVALSVGFAAAVESVALYVGWHAHDALLMKGYRTARQLRRCSYLIAAAVGAMNYAHFAGEGLRPTAAACAFGLLSVLSPWMWGLHTRRQQHIQLLRERKVDGTGAEFSAERRRNFPIRSWQARRWSIDHNVTDPGEAWKGYNAERSARAVRAVAPVDTPPVAPRPTVDRPAVAPDRPTEPVALEQAAAPAARARAAKSVKAVAEPVDRPAHSPSAVANAAILRERYPTGLTDSDYAIKKAVGWSHDRLVKAKAAYVVGADLGRSS